MKIAHLINPVKVTPTSDLYVAQPITFESMRVAKQFASTKVEVELFAISYQEDLEIIPDYFTVLPVLTRSVLDFGNFLVAKKYPLIGDVLLALYNHTDAEYLVFSNMDISLMPHFYIAVSSIIQTGHDAVIINRRGISTSYKSIEELPLMYSDLGKPHPGFDCFVFKRELLAKFILENICVGVSFSEITLLHNFIAFASNLRLVDDLHLTFHIGMEVMPPLNPEFYWHNRKE